MRPINNGTTTAERIVLNKQVEAAKAAAYTKGNRLPRPQYAAMRSQRRARDQMDEEPGNNPDFFDADGSGEDVMNADDSIVDDQADIPEAFLTVLPGSTCATNIGKDKPRALLDVLQCVSKPNDMYFTKSHYSALRSGELIQTLRMQLITELYICGALSNTSVYATAMDAASHGFQITLVEDCLGYRDRKRHDHALSLLDEETGCAILTKDDLIHEIEEKNHGQTTSRRPVRDQESEELTDLLGMLMLKSDASTKPRSDANDTKGELNCLPARPSITGTTLAVDDDSPATSDAIKTAVINGKTRVKSKILQRRDLERDETRDDIGTKRNDIDALASLMAKLDAHQISIADQQPPGVTEHSPDSKTGSSEGEESKNGLPASKRVKSTFEKLDTVETSATSASSASSAKSNGMLPSKTPAAAEVLEMPRWKEGEPICEGDTVVITNLLPPDRAEVIFNNLKTEAQWQRMSHQGGEVPRLVAVQGEIGPDGSIPIYRHPADESPPLLAFSPTVSIIRREVEKAAGHEINHCLIQFYRDGKDYISEHSDKTLDIVPNTYICNVSLGAERTMVFRGKRDPRNSDSTSEEINPRSTVRASLPHNSMMRMGLKTNMRWMHSIRQDKRRDEDKTAAEQDFGGCRISLTFRLIGTFLSKDQSMTWGQGATAKDKESARRVVNGPTEEAKKMVEAFGRENRLPDFDWFEVYGQGFDVLHMSNERKLLLSGNSFVDDGVLAAIAHLRLGVKWAPNPAIADPDAPNQHFVKLVDTDSSRSTVEGYAAVLLYLDAVYDKRASSQRTPWEYAKFYTRLMLATSHTADENKGIELGVWEAFAAEDVFMAGSEVSVVDFTLFPLVHGILQQIPMDALPKLRAYEQRLMELGAIKKVLAIVDAQNSAA